MKPVLGLLVLLAGAGFAQWRHFGDAPPPAASKPEEALIARSVSEGRTAFEREIVSSHNAVRRSVGTAPLLWSDQLAGIAQEWADHLLATGKFEHSHNPNYGENLYEITNARATPADVVNAWAGEVKDYNYASNSCHGVCGHYTQIIWGDTKEVGCAVARGGRTEVWVCNYDPPGNWIGRKPY